MKHSNDIFAMASLSARLPLVGVLPLAAIFLVWTWAAMPAAADDGDHGKGQLRVMTYNVDEGTDYIEAFQRHQFPANYLQAMTTIWNNVQATNPPERAAAIATQIGKAHLPSSAWRRRPSGGRAPRLIFKRVPRPQPWCTTFFSSSWTLSSSKGCATRWWWPPRRSTWPAPALPV